LESQRFFEIQKISEICKEIFDTFRIFEIRYFNRDSDLNVVTMLHHLRSK
jgi:hypothetical protein